MNTQFYILLNIKTGTELESYGKFFIGNKKATAYSIFNQLKGSREVNEKNMLYMELMETVNGLPVNLKLINCTLDELVFNCRLITKEIFKLFNLTDINQ